MDTHRQGTSYGDKMMGNDGMIGENRRWWPSRWPSSRRAQGRDIEGRNGWSGRVGSRGEKRMAGQTSCGGGEAQISYPALVPSPGRLVGILYLEPSSFSSISVICVIAFDRHTSHTHTPTWSRQHRVIIHRYYRASPTWPSCTPP